MPASNPTIDRQSAAFVAPSESTRVLKTLVSNLPGMVYRCRNDPSWTMEIVSDGCVTLTGHHASALLLNTGVSYADLINPDDRQAVWLDVQAAVAERRAFQVSYRITTANGVEKWVWEQGRGVFDSSGELLALEGFISDISARRRAEERLRERELMLDTIFEASPNALLLTDGNGIVKLANGVARRLFALDAQVDQPRSRTSFARARPRCAIRSFSNETAWWGTPRIRPITSLTKRCVSSRPITR